jgi:hypothetical protein
MQEYPYTLLTIYRPDPGPGPIPEPDPPEPPPEPVPNPPIPPEPPVLTRDGATVGLAHSARVFLRIESRLAQEQQP